MNARLPIMLAALAVTAATAAPASTPTFMQGVEAWEAGDASRCADLLLAVESAGAPVPTGGELLTAECLAGADRHDEALVYLRRQLPTGRIDLDELRGKSRPGLDALRTQAGWPALLVEAEQRAQAREAGMDHALRDELLRRQAIDQEIRQQVFVDPTTRGDTALMARMADIDRDNIAWLHGVLRDGWPDSDRVGHDGAKAAWLLVQHADADPALQRMALELMQRAVAAGRADPSDFALLTDRVLLAEDSPQRYGTQFQTGEDGRMRLRPVEDAGGLDARRAAVGLPPMAEYRALLQQMYGQPVE
ncbi:hypothetical protein LDO26_00300 [Luteimonas sp. BDR2-5]|uniref:DUF6624 domain-containing protein n=1 Tax=Proluteimonas luteida TaxID=2878685 RepID=UPI001E4931CB|nr:DUF6624 domain-containing protein [Luteimonas sp. BDR2-5]MCD9026654.1 hypothetical protein [Luteimonas sp. BDR2-5]